MQVDVVEYGEIRVLDVSPSQAAHFGAELRPRWEAAVYLSDAANQPLLRIFDGDAERGLAPLLQTVREAGYCLRASD
mgnify:CR=1 FL=1